jgi:hypothetical protein
MTEVLFFMAMLAATYFMLKAIWDYEIKHTKSSNKF